MKKLNFSIDINAPKEKVWKVLWNDATYRKWTSAFSEGSYAVSDWNEGSKVLFLAGNGDGMFSSINRHVPHEHMAFTHHGTIKGGVEQPEDEESKKWSGATESYLLNERDGKTELQVQVDVLESFEDYMNKTFPKALEIVKSLSEEKE